MKIYLRPTSRILTLFLVVLLNSIFWVSSYAQNITFHRIVPKPGADCVLVQGSLGLGSDEFILNKCGKKITVSKIPIGYTKQIQFISGDTAFGVVGSKLVKYQFGLRELTVDVIPLDEKDWMLEDVFFINESYGWACGRDGLILRTVDGGQTWEKLESGTDAFLREIRFTDNNFGWTLGRENRNNEFLEPFLITEDGGKTWNDVSLPEKKTISSAFFTSRVHGCGVAGRREFLCTSDGKFWNSIRLPEENGGRIFFLDAQNGWAAGDSILKTTDGGKKWKPSFMTSDTGHLNLDDVYFSNKQTGWVWGLSAVYQTSDGGQTWEKVSDKWLPEIKKAKLSSSNPYTARLPK